MTRLTKAQKKTAEQQLNLWNAVKTFVRGVLTILIAAFMFVFNILALIVVGVMFIFSSKKYRVKQLDLMKKIVSTG